MKYLVITILLIFSCNIINKQKVVCYLFIGSYTNNKPGKGIYVYKLDSKTGALEKVSYIENITNPSFLTIAPDGKYVYACTETSLPISGNVASFAFDSIKGILNPVNLQSSGGDNPVYLSVHRNNKFLVVGNYTGGTVSAYSINKDGSINPFIQNIQFSDSSIIKGRQDKAHIHCAVFSPDYEYIYLPDLGSDKIRAFKFDEINTEPLTGIDSFTVKTVPGSGPRHIIFHPNEKYAYCIEELSCMVSVYSYEKGKLKVLQRIKSGKATDVKSTGADVHISPDGLFLYTSNRKENTISIFSVKKEGALDLLGHEATSGETPRNFALDPTGNFLIVANQNTNNIVVFKRDSRTGLLKKTGFEIKVPNPSCLKMRTYAVQ